MLYYCLKCRNNTKSKNPKVIKVNHGRVMLTSNCAVCGRKISVFIKEQEAKGLLSMIDKIQLLGQLLI